MARSSPPSDARIDRILDTIMALAAGEFDARAELSEGVDALDAIVVGVNMLGEELAAKHQQLLESTAQAVHASRLVALGEMAAGVAHELNQPLNNMKLITQGVLRDISRKRLDAARLEENARETMALINRMAGIIDHMRIFARAPITDVSSTVDVLACVKGGLSLIREQLRSHGITLKTELDDEVRPVRGIPNNLEQVIINLLTNARDAVLSRREHEPRVAGEVIVRCRNGDDEVRIEVVDDGVGVPEEKRERIFEPFFTTKDPGRGTGLGLSIARQLLMGFGGTLELIPRNPGSCFRIVLPEHLAASPKPGSDKPPQQPPPPVSRRR